MKTTKIIITSASFAIAMSALAHAGVNSQGKALIGEPSSVSSVSGDVTVVSSLHGVEDTAAVGARRLKTGRQGTSPKG